ncbi:MAG: hypothetical protein Q8934_08645 [Bacillota bacterium]|nr:hypothetical protein [Bacillota bacterium]
MQNPYVKELTSMLDLKIKAFKECEKELYTVNHSHIVKAALRNYHAELQQEIERYNRSLIYALQSEDIS